ncbi:MAG: hypothetical protein HQM10_06665 [Candidatus Riflebacteria bacterium]|nr:hypothetical protein [Candidatus Riflebacteria bacterium]
MVKLYQIYSECKNRKFYLAFPLQIACRLLGREDRFCPIDKLCQKTDQFGIPALYAITFAALLMSAALTFWVLKFLRLNRILNFVFRFFYPVINFCISVVLFIVSVLNRIAGEE